MKRTRQDFNKLTEGPVWRGLLGFFLPIAAGTLIQQLYNAVDGIIVGRYVGTVALAAVGGSSATIINLLIGFFVAVTSGAAVVISQIFGAGREEDAHSASTEALIYCALAGLGLAVIGFVLAPGMLRLMKTPEDTLPGSILYLRIYFAGVPFILTLNMESNLLRAVGDSYHPFVDMIAGCLSNIALDLLFVLCFHWGVAGVAIATVLAQLLNMGLQTYRLFGKRSVFKLVLRRTGRKNSYLHSMLKIGIPAGLQNSMYSVSNMVIQVGVNTLGTVVAASWAMSSKTDGFYWSVISSFGTAVTTFVGQNMGAGKINRIKTCLKQGFWMAMGATVVIGSLLLLAAIPLLHILTTDQAVVDTTYLIMLYIVPFYITWVPVEIFSGVLRGAGDAVNPVIIIGLGTCLLRVIWVFTVFAHFGTLFSLCLCYGVSWSLTGGCLVLYYKLRGGAEGLHRCSF